MRWREYLRGLGLWIPDYFYSPDQFLDTSSTVRKEEWGNVKHDSSNAQELHAGDSQFFERVRDLREGWLHRLVAWALGESSEEWDGRDITPQRLASQEEAASHRETLIIVALAVIGVTALVLRWKRRRQHNAV